MNKFAATLKSIVKIALQSNIAAAFGALRRKGEAGGTVVVMANGPSLKESLDSDRDVFLSNPCIAVNFAPISDEFFMVKPSYLVLADPHFFKLRADDANLCKLQEAMARIDWELTLFVSAKFASQARRMWPNDHVKVSRFNAIGLDGFGWFRYWAYKHRLGMPRPRNVAIPALMIALWLGYREVLLFGADHSWMKTISVTDENEVVSIQPHFYKEDKREEERVRHEYRGYRLHTIVESFAVAFRSYHGIEEFARKIGARIVNLTPGSMIDAFVRRR